MIIISNRDKLFIYIFVFIISYFEGDKLKRKITIRIIGLGYYDKCQACIKIYNNCNKCVFEGKTYNGRANVCLNVNQCYYINIFFCGGKINRRLFVSNLIDIYTIILPNALVRQRINNNITFLLTDSNYLGLPIESGKVILWQKQ